MGESLKREILMIAKCFKRHGFKYPCSEPCSMDEVCQSFSLFVEKGKKLAEEEEIGHQVKIKKVEAELDEFFCEGYDKNELDENGFPDCDSQCVSYDHDKEGWVFCPYIQFRGKHPTQYNITKTEEQGEVRKCCNCKELVIIERMIELQNGEWICDDCQAEELME